MAITFEYDRKRAMKHKDFSPCASCGKGVMHTGVPLFYRITIEHMGIDARAVQRQAGLEQFFAGNAMLANIMGPDDDLGLPIGDAVRGLLCATCGNSPETCFALIAEALQDRQRKKEDAAGSIGQPKDE